MKKGFGRRVRMIYYSAYRYKDDEVSRMNVDQEYMQVNCVGSYQLEEEDYCITQRKRGRKDFLLIYTHTGRSMVRFGAEEQEAAAGTAYLYRPGEEQFYGQIRNICTKCYWVCFSGYGVNALLDDLEIPTGEILDIGADRWLPVTFESMISAVMKKTAHYEIHTAILMQQLLYKVSELLASRAGRNEPEISECVGTSINYMNLNYQKKNYDKRAGGKQRSFGQPLHTDLPGGCRGCPERVSDEYPFGEGL